MRRSGCSGEKTPISRETMKGNRVVVEPLESARHDVVPRRAERRPPVREALGGRARSWRCLGVWVVREEHGSGVRAGESPPGLSLGFSFLLSILALKFL